MPTPSAPEPPADGHRFVVQRHRATRLHYDLRLEVGGVLASWAVPKGPTLDPKARRLAVQVEDHELSYFAFEGVHDPTARSPRDAIVWDWGTWAPAAGVDGAAAIAAGELHFDLAGVKLHGRFVLTRTRVVAGKQQWLLLHKNDPFAIGGWDAEAHPRSVKSGLTNDEVNALG